MHTPSRRRFLATLGAAVIAAHSPGPLAAAPSGRRRIPRDGRTVPAIGLGTWQAFDYADDAAADRDALATLKLLADAAGVVDSSPMYGRSEAVLGRLLRDADPERAVFVATKVWTRGKSEGRAQIDESMRLIGRDPIDLLQIHNLSDYDTQLATVLELKAAGRVRYAGATHYTAGAHAELVRAIEGGKLDFVQVNYSLREREAARTVFPAARANGVAVLVNRPFAEGDVFRATKGKPLPDFAREIGAASWAQYALKFILGEAAVTCAIPGTRNPKHCADNLGAATGPMPDAALCRRMAEHFDTL
ncbi:aldo/keto reductase [Tahibacter soli]|uniref:Aldo/keto reductase n=1 Tax=Tahibacter soli TaxID=2983605 RepID=A0A9X4BLZ4_9GAMM|nr:aldo/keto reductase [Tahibacter soli]MDC8014774.1 aldo/keto reductase [Tahibacter soli]